MNTVQVDQQLLSNSEDSFMILCISVSPVINQYLCTTPCIQNHISVTAPLHFGVYRHHRQEAQSNYKIFMTLQMIISN